MAITAKPSAALLRTLDWCGGRTGGHPILLDLAAAATITKGATIAVALDIHAERCSSMVPISLSVTL